ncbi:MAG: proline--tRNA ligase [Chitinivibrionales bacterium]|nr:proline--tRNA ligase [Chitinivibrionales bacterium]MBD3396070.1 proline--tRNA ligase [Chitinivibrionales bacterium]
MRFADAFIHTLREDPAEAELVSHKLMLRAGMIQKLASGIYNYLPLGLRVIRKIEAIIRDEMAACGATELLMPAVIPSELWQESGRWSYYGPELLRLRDRKQNEFCIGPTHEEVIVDVARHGVRSYRDLPTTLYQIQSKFRDEVRPRYGLMRAREFIMKDAYSFHANEASLDATYWRMHQAYTRIFHRCGLDFRPVEADSGTIGGDVTHEFHVLADSGEDTIASCDACDYAANIEKAAHRDDGHVADVPDNAPVPEEVATPGKKSIEDVCAFLNARASDAIKLLVYDVNDGEYLVAVCIRGDQEINEAKLRGLLSADSVAIPDDADLAARTGLAVGFLGAHSLDRSCVREVIADWSVRGMTDCIAGANKPDAHVRHIYPARDLRIDRWADVGFVSEGESCPRCENGALRLRRGIEVGQVFKLGRKYAAPMHLSFLNEKGEQELVTMGCYGIGVGRTAAAAIEQHHDADGIIWPVGIAPYTVALLSLDPGNDEVRSVCARLHDELEQRDIDVLLDDREERPGVKFKDADLIGFPVRIVVGGRKVKGGTVEVRQRAGRTVEEVAFDKVADHVVTIVTSPGAI